MTMDMHVVSEQRTDEGRRVIDAARNAVGRVLRKRHPKAEFMIGVLIVLPDENRGGDSVGFMAGSVCRCEPCLAANYGGVFFDGVRRFLAAASERSHVQEVNVRTGAAH